jgi:hypothetical protein
LKVRHRVAVRTDRAQILDWINRPLFSLAGHRLKVVYVDVSFRSFAVCGAERKSADVAGCSVMLDAQPTG